MQISEKTLKTLEFDKIREMLAECAPTEGAKKRALALSPVFDYDKIIDRQSKTDDAKRLLSFKGFPPLGGKESVLDSAERAEKGAVLSPSELIDIASLLFSVRGTIDYINTDKPFPTALDAIFQRLIPNRGLEERIRKTIISEDLISDDASPELSEIRRKIKAENNKIKDTLQSYIGGARLKYLQENIVTMRDGRYVVPVKSEYRSEVDGLLHDTSSSGSTLFIEPMAVVEANNRLKLLQNKEKAEIERILAEISAMCADFSYSLELDYNNITEISFYFACASFAQSLRAVRPLISKKAVINLVKARHPLIPKSKVVPVDVGLGENYSTMIITGPNTGGKTVTLKTLGLFAAMTQSGLQIPAEENSTVGIFDSVLVDIGDEQSIAESLSTFSSHMVNISSMLSEITERSLVLFDELGAGTDPVEGAALAIAIIEYVKGRGALCAATTHYAELKAYALETDGVTNASCEFNVETLAPTYRLIIGSPGKSNAFAISRKLGIPSEIVDRADAMISSENKSFENVIEKLENSRMQMEKLREETQKMRDELAVLRKNEEEKLRKKSEEAEKEIEKNRQKAKDLFDSARATSEYVFSELEQLKRKKEKEDFARAFNEARADLKNRIRDGIDMYDKTAPRDITFDDDYKLPRELKIGDKVYLTDIAKEGEITALADRKGLFSVRCGIIRAKAEKDKIRLLEDAKPTAIRKKQPQTHRTVVKSSASATFRPEIDLRGMYADDAWFKLDKYLDDAILTSVNEVRVIHGKGTGVLRRTIQEKLELDGRVKSFRNGNFGEGDLGVTIVTLK